MSRDSMGYFLWSTARRKTAAALGRLKAKGPYNPEIQQKKSPMFKGLNSIFTRHGVTYGVRFDGTIVIIRIG